jgi:hypothetical protein
MLLLEKLIRDLGFTMYEMFEEFKGSKFNCLRRSKVQVLKSLKCLKGFGIWVLEFGFWNLTFYPGLIPKKN